MISSKRIHQKIINKMVALFNKYHPLIKAGSQMKVFDKFLTHIKLDKELTIKRLISEGMSQATAYRTFDKVSEIIGANQKGGYYVFDDM